MTPETVGSKIKAMRNAHAKTQAELGEIIGVSNVTISNYERGTVVPPTEKLRILAEFFNINVSFLIGDSKHLYEPGVVYAAPKKVPLITQKLALNLPEMIVPHASEYIEVPIDYTNNNTFAVQMYLDDILVTVVAERDNRKTPFLLCNKDATLLLRTRNDAADINRKNIIGGVLYFL